MAIENAEDLYNITTTFIINDQKSLSLGNEINVKIAGTSYDSNERKYQSGIIKPKNH